MVLPNRKKTAKGKAWQKGKTVTPESTHVEVHQLTGASARALHKTLPGVLARLMPDLVSAAPVQASRSDHNEGAVVVDWAEEESEDDTQVSGTILHHTGN